MLLYHVIIFGAAFFPTQKVAITQNKALSLTFIWKHMKATLRSACCYQTEITHFSAGVVGACFQISPRLGDKRRVPFSIRFCEKNLKNELDD